jgi:hypothetical protein
MNDSPVGSVKGVGRGCKSSEAVEGAGGSVTLLLQSYLGCEMLSKKAYLISEIICQPETCRAPLKTVSTG